MGQMPKSSARNVEQSIDMNSYTGQRSAQFDFLLDMENPVPASMEERKKALQKNLGGQSYYNKYVSDLSGGDK